MFRDEYPRYPTIEVNIILYSWYVWIKNSIFAFIFQDLNILPEEMNYTIDLRPFLNPSPYTVQHVSNDLNLMNSKAI